MESSKRKSIRVFLADITTCRRVYSVWDALDTCRAFRHLQRCCREVNVLGLSLPVVAARHTNKNGDTVKPPQRIAGGSCAEHYPQYQLGALDAELANIY